MLYSYALTKWQGTADYAPKRHLTREEAARFTVEFAINVLCRKPTYIYTNQFNDIEGANPELIPYIKKAYEYVIFHGDGGGGSLGFQTTFRPHDIISYDELIAVLIRLVRNEYSEEPGTDWARWYRAYMGDHVSKETQPSSVREPIAELIYDLYKLNLYDWRDVGYVIRD